jgi:deoxycytidylate deaminase
MLINAGIERIVYEEGYADDLARAMLKESGTQVEKFDRKQKAVSSKQKADGRRQ